MKRVWIVLLLALVALPAAQAGGDPRAEQERLTAADTALARRAAVNASDLGAGWLRAPTSSSDERVNCPGFDPDFSAFTITGKAQSAFQHPSGASVVSAVEVYATETQAVGDFRLGAKPALGRCLGRALEQELARTGGGLSARVSSARVAAAPNVGHRAAAWRVVVTIRARGTSVRLYLDVLGVQRGRSIVGLFFTSATKPFPGQVALARRVAARMR